MNAIIEKIGKIGLVPVIKIEDVEKAVPLAEALCKGGLPCAEVTFRTAQAEEAIRRITEALPEMLVGAGTVLTSEQVDRAVGAGAKFIVSPGFNRKIVTYCIEKGIPVTPGCSSPSDVEQAIECGLDVVKFFPAEAAGGLPMIKALCGPYVNLKFMPTGGISAKNLNEYLSFKKILACGGSWMVKEDLIQNGDFEAITALAREAVGTMLGFELAHIGINAENEQQATQIANGFASIFNFAAKPGNSSIFAGTAVEVMKAPYLGKNGHIAIRTNYIERAVNYLEMQGVKFNEQSKKLNAKGELAAIYLAEEIGGFAVHLVQK